MSMKSHNFWKIGGVAVLIALVAALTACGAKSTPVPTPVALQGNTVEVVSETFGEVSVTTFEIPTDVLVSIESPEGDVVVVLESETIGESAELKFTPLPEAAIEELPELPAKIANVTRVFDLTLEATEPTGTDAAAVEDAAEPELLKPLTITISYQESDLANGDPINLGIMHLSNEEWTPLLTAVDEENSTVSAQVESLSVLALSVGADPFNASFFDADVVASFLAEEPDADELAEETGDAEIGADELGDESTLPGEQPAADAEAAPVPGQQLAEPAQVGPQGDPGPAGPQGGPGPAGPAGSQGATGSTGPVGAAGAVGPAGAAGAAGATGPEGVPGAIGPEGVPGSTGPEGVAGAAGAEGAPGSAGATGATGSTGSRGSTGAQGAPGADGAAGESGAAALGTSAGEDFAAGNTTGDVIFTSDNVDFILSEVDNAFQLISAAAGSPVLFDISLGDNTPHITIGSGQLLTINSTDFDVSSDGLVTMAPRRRWHGDHHLSQRGPYHRSGRNGYRHYQRFKPESTEGGGRVSALKRQEGAPVLLG